MRLQTAQPLYIPPPNHPAKKTLDLRDVIIYRLINLHILTQQRIFDKQVNNLILISYPRDSKPDETNLEMVARHFPWFLPIYNSLPPNICQADVSRYMNMYAFGGVYVDFDVEALKPMDNLISWASRSKLTSAKRVTLPRLVSLAEIAEWSGEHKRLNNIGAPVAVYGVSISGTLSGKQGAEVERLHGPHATGTPEPNFFLEPGLIFPLDWQDVPKHLYEICCAALDTFDHVRCKVLYNSTTVAREKPWTITYWSHSWEGESLLWNILEISNAELEKGGDDGGVNVSGLDKRSAKGEDMYKKIKNRRNWGLD
ncbi:hypothetical protein BJ742DRAFT_771578 [Cladochytrium replicatum]|nr:hypothetical protein BJ742DRAFT_771578 [Cladochytrium replicatum]